MEKIRQIMEIERIVNLAKGFGWELVETKAEGDTLRIVIEKKKVELPE